jgi:hypothetical protein
MSKKQAKSIDRRLNKIEQSVANKAKHKSNAKSNSNGVFNRLRDSSMALSMRYVQQRLDTETAVRKGQLTPSIAHSVNPVSLISTVTEISASAVNRFGDGSQDLTAIITPRWQDHIVVGTAYDGNGTRTTTSVHLADGYSAYSGLTDVYACCAMALEVKYTGREDAASGLQGIVNLNPLSDSTWSADLIHNLDATVTAPVNALHYQRQSWMPEQEEWDDLAVSPTATPNGQETGIAWAYKGPPLSASQPASSFQLKVYAVWAIYPLVTADSVMSTKYYPLDSSMCSMLLALELRKSPVNSIERVMRADDSSNVIDQAVSTAKSVAGGVRGVGKLLTGDFSGVGDILGGISSVSSFISSLTVEEKVSRTLLSFTDDELLYMSKVLNKPRSYHHRVVEEGIVTRRRRKFARNWEYVEDCKTV